MGYLKSFPKMGWRIWTIALFLLFAFSPFAHAAPVITVTSPNGGETWQLGSTQTIRWTHTGSPGTAVKIELLKGGAISRILSSSTPIGNGGKGSFSWVIPSSVIAGSDYQIRVTSTSKIAYTDTSDKVFKIVSPAPVTGASSSTKTSGASSIPQTSAAGLAETIDLLPFFCPACVNEGMNQRNLVGGECFYTYPATVKERDGFYIVKSCNDKTVFEEFAYDDNNIYHLADTSWATWDGSNWTAAKCFDGRIAFSTYLNGNFGEQNGSCDGFNPQMGNEGNIWVPRYMTVGQQADNLPTTIVAMAKDNCTCCQAQYTGPTGRWVKLISKEPMDLGNGLGVKDVIRIAIMDGPGKGENFWYARNFGWVGFGFVDPPDGNKSYYDVTHIGGVDYSGQARQSTCSSQPPQPPANCQATVPGDRWKGEYFNNMNLSGAPSLVRDDGNGFLSFDWGMGSPGSSCGIGADNFSIRWTRAINFSSGNYIFTATADDGVRLWIDGQLKIDKWIDQPPTSYSSEAIYLEGNHTVKMEYYENKVGAVARLSWQGTPVPPSNCQASAGGDRWKGEYFNNTILSGSPSMVRDDGNGFLSFEWGFGSPGSSCGIGADSFSTRWTRNINFDSANYTFTVIADDGVRLWIDGQLKLDKWIIQAPTTYTVGPIYLQGNHTLKMEYYENTGGATAKLSWQGIPVPPSNCVASVAADQWKGEYFNNMTLTGTPSMTRDDGAGFLDFDWGTNSPSSNCGIGADNFSVRWTRTVNFSSGNYQFAITSDDGVRFWIDDQLKLDKWFDQGATAYQVGSIPLAGNHVLKMEYYDNKVSAVAKISWVGTPIPPVNGPLATGWEDGEPQGFSNRVEYSKDVSNAQCTRQAGNSHNGSFSLMMAGNSQASYAYAYHRVFDLNLAVSSGMKIGYWIKHLQGTPKIAVDGHFIDGNTIRDFNGQSLKDQNGVAIHPALRQDAMGQWIYVEVDLSSAAGNTLDYIMFAFDNGGNGFTGPYLTYVDDFRIFTSNSPPQPPPSGNVAFESGWEEGQPSGFSDRVEYSKNVAGYLNSSTPPPECGKRPQENVHTGNYSLMLAGYSQASYSYCYYRAFDLNVQVTSGMKLGYWIYHTEGTPKIAVDGHFTDGNTIRDFGGGALKDQNGVPIHPTSRIDPMNQWIYVEVDLTPATGKTLDYIMFAFDNGGDGFTGRYRAHVDDFRIFTPGTPPPPPPQPSGKSKLTIHTGFQRGGVESMRFIEQAQPAVIKILDSMDWSIQVKNKSPNTKIVGRIYITSQPQDGNPEVRAQEWWDQVKGRIFREVDYWEGYNEPPIPSIEAMQWYARFEKKRVEILAANGLKACIGSFSVGVPDVTNPAMWPAFYPAIDAAISYGGVLGVHEYSAPTMAFGFDSQKGEGWYTGRYRKVYRQHLIPDNKVIPLVITECGIDGGITPGQPNEPGWKVYYNDENCRNQKAQCYFNDLVWYDNLLKADNYVLGATIFSLEIPGWDNFDIGGEVVNKLIPYVRGDGGGNPPDPPQPPQPPQPPTGITWDPRLDALNIVLEPAQVSAGQTYWRLIKALYHEPNEPFNPQLPGGDHHIYMEIVDEQGNRMAGQKAVVKNGGTTYLTIEDKPYPDYGCNFGMYGMLGSYSAWADGMPSDKVTGMGLPMKQHVTFYLTFQRAVK